jgi:hypothetical protein
MLNGLIFWLIVDLFIGDWFAELGLCVKLLVKNRVGFWRKFRRIIFFLAKRMSTVKSFFWFVQCRNRMGAGYFFMIIFWLSLNQEACFNKTAWVPYL